MSKIDCKYILNIIESKYLTIKLNTSDMHIKQFTESCSRVSLT